MHNHVAFVHNFSNLPSRLVSSDSYSKSESFRPVEHTSLENTVHSAMQAYQRRPSQIKVYALLSIRAAESIYLVYNMRSPLPHIFFVFLSPKRVYRPFLIQDPCTNFPSSSNHLRLSRKTAPGVVNTTHPSSIDRQTSVFPPFSSRLDRSRRLYFAVGNFIVQYNGTTKSSYPQHRLCELFPSTGPCSKIRRRTLERRRCSRRSTTRHVYHQDTTRQSCFPIP